VNRENPEMDAFSDGGAPIHMAAQIGSLDCTRELINAGADINSRCNYKQETPLHIAVDFSHSDLCSWLIDNGSDPTIKNKSGQDVLEAAGPSIKLDDTCITKIQKGKKNPNIQISQPQQLTKKIQKTKKNRHSPNLFLFLLFFLSFPHRNKNIIQN